MSNKKILIRKDQKQIDRKLSDLRYNLKDAQKYIDWYHSIDFVEPLNGIDQVKEFLTNPNYFYEKQVKRHLTQLTGLKTLPPDIEPLKTMYQIPASHGWSVSEKFGFEYLQFESGKLSYSQEIYDLIEVENTVYATPEQAQALHELDRTWQNCMKIVEMFSPQSDTWRRIHTEFFEKAFELITKPTGIRPDGNNTLWDLEKLEKLANSGFGKSINN